MSAAAILQRASGGQDASRQPHHTQVSIAQGIVAHPTFAIPSVPDVCHHDPLILLENDVYSI